MTQGYSLFDPAACCCPGSQCCLFCPPRMPKTIALTFSGIIDGAMSPNFIGGGDIQGSKTWSQFNGTWNLTLTNFALCTYSCAGPTIGGQPTTISATFAGGADLCSATVLQGTQFFSQCNLGLAYRGGIFSAAINLSFTGGAGIMTMLTRGSCLSPTTAFSGLYDDYFTTALGCEWFPDPPPRNAPCGNTFYGWQSVSTGSGNMNNCGCSGLCGQDGNGNEIDPAFADSTGVTVPSDPSVGGGTFSFPPITMRPLASNPCVFTALIHSSDPAGFTTDERWTLSCTPGKALNLVITGTIVSSGGALVNSAGAGWSCNIGSNVCGQTYTLTSTGAGVPPVQVSFP